MPCRKAVVGWIFRPDPLYLGSVFHGRPGHRLPAQPRSLGLGGACRRAPIGEAMRFARHLHSRHPARRRQHRLLRREERYEHQAKPLRHQTNQDGHDEAPLYRLKRTLRLSHRHEKALIKVPGVTQENAWVAHRNKIVEASGQVSGLGHHKHFLFAARSSVYRPFRRLLWAK